MITKFLIEGIDHLGKSTLIDGIQQKNGYHLVVHYQKPKRLEAYSGDLERYQQDCFNSMFKIITSGAWVICDRAHLGECVYAPIYRHYPGDYVFNMEIGVNIQMRNDIKLILLTENFEKSKHFVDDGLSFDISKRKQEQELFIEAFNKSSIRNRKIICVTADDGQFRSKEDILKEALE